MELRGCGGLLRSSLWFAVVLRCAVLFSWSIPVDGTETGKESWISTGAFEHIDSVRFVSCNRHKSDLGSLKISNYNNTSPLILLKISSTTECKTSSTFTSCMVDDDDATVTALITDLTVGETRVYECVATYLLDTTKILKASVNVTFNDVTTAQPSTTVSTQSATAREPWTDMCTESTSGAAVRGTERDDVLYFATLGVGATLVVVVAIDIIAVVCLWRRQWKMPCRDTDDEELIPPIRENPTPADNRPAQEEEPQSPDGDIRDVSDEAASDARSYQSLRMDDVGVRSPYEDLRQYRE